MQFNLNLPFWPLNGKHEVKSPFLTMTVYLQGCLLPMNQLPNSISCSLTFIMTRKIQHLISLIIRIPVLTFIARDIRVTQGVELLWMQWSQFKERLPMDQTSKLSSLCWHAFILWCQKLKVLSFVMLSSLLLGAPIGMRIRHYSCLLSHPTSNVNSPLMLIHNSWIIPFNPIYTIYTQLLCQLSVRSHESRIVNHPTSTRILVY